MVDRLDKTTHIVLCSVGHNSGLMGQRPGTMSQSSMLQESKCKIVSVYYLTNLLLMRLNISWDLCVCQLFLSFRPIVV